MKYVVLKPFTDKYDKTQYNVGDTLDITKKRAKEILSVDTLIEEVKDETVEE